MMPAIPLQAASEDIWDKKYRLKNKNNDAVDTCIEDTYSRVAAALAKVEEKDKRAFWHNRFVWALANGAIPAGRIMSNAGAKEHKPATSTINCTVSGVIPDSMDGILSMVKEAGLTLKAGCGIGYEFSTLRPKGAYVSGAGAYTSGPLSFMDIYDKMCFTVSSAGGRRGAQMGTFDISHPDVIDFIKAKREDGRLRQFNLSCLITRDFMEAVKSDNNWDLVFPATPLELDGNDTKIAFKYVANPPSNAVQDDQGLTACRIYKTIKARRLWDVIMSSTYDYAEPGFILIDEVNDLNNNWFCENVRATNPCGEQPLPPYGACLLGSINLTKFVREPFTAQAHFDWDAYREVIAVFTRMLDNVVEINGLPLEQQREEIVSKRRHGMGFLGLGSALTMLREVYGSASSLEFTENIAYEMAKTGFEIGVQLAEEKGAAPIMDQDFEVTAAMLHQRPAMAKDGIKLGDSIKGRILWAKYSKYMQKFA
ncbi:MAG: adenosylcobalamin-dependent ribonucleoside-diphosphate reductase, partial [Ghiorsea sp.]